MQLIFTKPKLAAAIVGAVLILTIVIINLQISLTAVSASIFPIVVHEEHLDFGTVFPGEEQEGNFVVSISPDYVGDGITYRIIQKRKPLPEGHPELPDGGDPGMPGFYRDLCPHLTKVSNEGEGDIESNASVGGLFDESDAWIIYFKVPAIIGNIGQDHVGGVITEDGEYGCDVSIDIIEIIIPQE